MFKFYQINQVASVMCNFNFQVFPVENRGQIIDDVFNLARWITVWQKFVHWTGHYLIIFLSLTYLKCEILLLNLFHFHLKYFTFQIYERIRQG